LSIAIFLKFCVSANFCKFTAYDGTDKTLCHNIFPFAWLRSLRENIIDMSNYSELQCVAGEYISPAATSVPPLGPVPALPVELVLLRSFFSFF
jgi:hypothetical protein